MPETDIRAQALDRLSQTKRALENAKAPFTAVTWELLPEERRAPYRAAMAPFVDAIADMLTAPPRVIETAAQLNRAELGTIIRTAAGDAAVCRAFVGSLGETRWFLDADKTEKHSGAIPLPAIVLWTAAEEVTHA